MIIFYQRNLIVIIDMDIGVDHQFGFDLLITYDCKQSYILCKYRGSKKLLTIINIEFLQIINFENISTIYV